MSDTLFSPVEEPDQDLTADREEISRFCDAVFRYVETGFVQFRTFRDKPETGTWGTPWESASVADLPALIDKAARIATKAARTKERVVFAPPVVVLKSPRSATEADISKGPALSQDCDAHPVQARQKLTHLLGEPTCVVFSGGQWTDPETGEVQPKAHLHWRLQEPTRTPEDHTVLKECRRLAGVIVNSDHSAVPLVHPLRWPGSWHRKGEPRLVRAEINPDQEIDLYATLEILREVVGDEVAGSTAKDDLTKPRQSSPLMATDTLDVLAAMSVVPNGDLDWAAWNWIGMALWAATGGSSAGLAAWHGFSEKSQKYDASATTERWRHYSTSPPDRIGAGSIFHMAKEVCPRWQRPSVAAALSARWAKQDRETRQQIASGTFDTSEGVAGELGKRSDQSGGETDTPVAEQAIDARDSEIARLATLSPQKYFAERDSASEALGLKKSQLDQCVKAQRQALKERDRDRRKEPGTAYTGRKELDIGSDEEIANRVISDLLANGELRVHSEGAFYSYAGGVWKVLKEAEFQREFVSPYDGARYGIEGVVKLNKSKVESISWLTARNMEIGEYFVHAEPGINCENGFVRFRPDGRPELVPHNPDHRCRHILPGSWLSAEGFELPKDSLLCRFLNGLFRDDEDAADKRALIQEVAGAVVAGIGTRLGQPKAIVLFGRSANNGKSTLLDMLEGLVGDRACSHVSPHRFDHPNSAIAMMGKLLNTSAELTTADVIQSDTFKSAVTGEPIPGKILYKDMVDFRPVAQHVIATNKLPPFAGGIDKGVRRRLLVLVFERVIPQHEMIAGIAGLILRDEYDLFLAWAIEGASRLIGQGKFTTPKSSIEALEKWTRDTDPVRAWIEARVRPTPDPKRGVGYTRTTIFQRFESWAVENGHRKDRLPKSAEFIDRLAEDFPTIRHRSEQDRRIRGITVLDDDWADRPVLREGELFTDSLINDSLHELGDRMHRDHQEWVREMFRNSDGA